MPEIRIHRVVREQLPKSPLKNGAVAERTPGQQAQHEARILAERERVQAELRRLGLAEAG